MVHFTAAVTEGGAYRTFSTSVETQRAVYQRARELAAESDKDPAVLEHRDLHISSSVDRILGQPDTQQALVSLVYAAVAFLWTAFESVCRDAWTTALNARGVTLAQRILGELRRDDGEPDISRRQISVGLLAQYGFDLRDHLGTVLASKFDFSSVKGTKVAYEAAFGKDSEIAAAIDSRVIQ